MTEKQTYGDEVTKLLGIKKNQSLTNILENTKIPEDIVIPKELLAFGSKQLDINATIIQMYLNGESFDKAIERCSKALTCLYTGMTSLAPLGKEIHNMEQGCVESVYKIVNLSYK